MNNIITIEIAAMCDTFSIHIYDKAGKHVDTLTRHSLQATEKVYKQAVAKVGIYRAPTVWVEIGGESFRIAGF